MSDSNQLAGAVQDAINITHLEASAKSEVIKAEYALANAKAAKKIVEQSIQTSTSQPLGL